MFMISPPAARTLHSAHRCKLSTPPCLSLSRHSHHWLAHHRHPSRRLHLTVAPPSSSHPHRHCCHPSSGSSSSSGCCHCCHGDDAWRTSSLDREDLMPPPLSRLLPPLVNGRSTAAAAVLLPPAPPACFYGSVASAMYQSSMRKPHVGLSPMTDALLLDRHNDDVEAQHGRHWPPRHLPRQQQQPLDDIDTNHWS